jgi:hypothetical protein
MVVKSYRYLKTLSLALAVELAISSGLSATAIQYSQQQQPQNSRGELLALQRRLRFSVRGLRASRGLRGGAARGGCLPNNDGLKPIVPMNQPQQTASSQADVEVYSVSTIAARPKFFVYVPQTSAQKAKFTLSSENEKNLVEASSENEKNLVEATFALTGTPGVVSFSLPTNAPPLEVGKTYKWSVQIVCETGDGDNGGNLIAEGEVERIQPPAALVNIEKVAPRQRLDLYVDAQLWYDSVTTLAELQHTNPQNLSLKKDWEDLLNSVHLDTVAKALLLPEVTLFQESNQNN